MSFLKTKNPHERDSRISFVDSSHTYFIDGSSEGYISSTTLVHSFFPHFDADKIIKKMMSSKNWHKSPYKGQTPEQIKKGWDSNRDKAAAAGTAMHENIEMYYNNENHDKYSREFVMFSNFEKDFSDLKPYRTEWEVFDEFSKVAGSIDMIYEDPVNEGNLIIADWKRSKEIKMDNRWQKGTHKLTRHLDDCNFIHYSLQLAIYKYILQVRYGKKVSSTFLVILHPKQENYIKIDTLELDDVVEKIMSVRMGKSVNIKEIDEKGFQFSSETIKEVSNSK